MARQLKQLVLITSDLDGTELDESNAAVIEFAVEGTLYTLDASDVEVKEFMEFLHPYREAASKHIKLAKVLRPRKTANDDGQLKLTEIPQPGKTRSKKQPRRDVEARNKIRAWCQRQGYDVGPLGKIPTDYLIEYQATHPRAYIPAGTLQALEDALAIRERNARVQDS